MLQARPLARTQARPLTPVVQAPAFATGALSFNGNVADGETVTIGSTVYRYVTALAQAYDVLIGATASITINNHIAAINDSGGEGTVYGTGTAPHPDVTASSRPGIMDVTAKIAGSAGNSIVTTTTSLTAAWGAGTLQGGGFAISFATAFANDLSALRNWFIANTGPRVAISPAVVTGTQVLATQADANALIGKRVSGRIQITGNNIELRDFVCEWDGSGTGALLVELVAGATGARIHHFLLDGKYGNISYGIGGTTFSTGCVITNGEIRHMGGDAVRTFKNSTYRHLYCHSFREWDTAVDGVYDPNGDQNLFPHTDAIQTIRSGNVVEECWFENTDAQNATSGVIIKSDTDETITSFTMRRCFVDGGGVPFYIDNLNSNIDSPGAFGQPTGIVLENLLIGRAHREARAFRQDEVPSANITKTNIRYIDTGALIESFFLDDFNRANENLEARNFDRMSGVAGQLAINTNQVQSVSVAAQGTYLLQTAFGVSLTDHFVEADWKSGTTTGWLIARYIGEADYVGMQINGGVPTLYTRIGGAFVIRVSSPSSLTAGDKVRIECFGQIIRLWHKGILRGTYDMGPGVLASGRVGLQARTLVANPMCDNFAAGGLLA